MKDKIEQIIEGVMALESRGKIYTDGVSIMGVEVVCSTDDLKLLATELLRLRDALAAAEACVGHYADDMSWDYYGDSMTVYRHGRVEEISGVTIAVKAQAEIKRIKGE